MTRPNVQRVAAEWRRRCAASSDGARRFLDFVRKARKSEKRPGTWVVNIGPLIEALDEGADDVLIDVNTRLSRDAAFTSDVADAMGVDVSAEFEILDDFFYAVVKPRAPSAEELQAALKALGVPTHVNPGYQFGHPYLVTHDQTRIIWSLKGDEVAWFLSDPSGGSAFLPGNANDYRGEFKLGARPVAQFAKDVKKALGKLAAAEEAKRAEKAKAESSDAGVTRALEGLTWRGVGGGRFLSVESVGKGEWSAEPRERARLDHYTGQDYQPDEDDDPEGWDQDGWQEEYAGPLESAVQKALDEEFGPGVLRVVDVGEKGHVDIARAR